MRYKDLTLVAFLLIVGACESPQVDANSQAPDADPPAAASDAPPAGTAAAGWVVTPSGAGELRIGMSLAQLTPFLSLAADTADVGNDCHYLPVADAPDGMWFMVEGRQLVRVDVLEGETATAEGARVGDSEERILELYPDVRRQPHKYTDGFYLIAVPDAPSDTLHRYVFATDGQQVTEYRAGIYPQVEYVEGCA